MKMNPVGRHRGWRTLATVSALGKHNPVFSDHASRAYVVFLLFGSMKIVPAGRGLEP